MNTYETLVLEDENEVKLTLNLKKILSLKSFNREVYEKLNRIIINGTNDIFDLIYVIYSAYLCALEDEVKPMTYDDFFEVVPQNLNKLILLVDRLISPKKKTVSEDLS